MVKSSYSLTYHSDMGGSLQDFASLSQPGTVSQRYAKRHPWYFQPASDVQNRTKSVKSLAGQRYKQAPRLFQEEAESRCWYIWSINLASLRAKSGPSVWNWSSLLSNLTVGTRNDRSQVNPIMLILLIVLNKVENLMVMLEEVGIEWLWLIPPSSVISPTIILHLA